MTRPGLQHVSPEHLPLGDGRFVQLSHLIGRGSTSTVYRGALGGLGGVERPVAVRLYVPSASEERDVVNTSIRDVLRSVSRVHHPNVVGTFDFVLLGAQAFAVHELVDGASLDTLTTHMSERGTRLPLDIAIYIAVEVVEALHGARVGKDPTTGRRLGLVHLGLTGREILLSRHGEVKVGDFGATLIRGASSGVRNLQAVGRRARWMAPEVARGEGGDERSDVFSAGMMLRELLLGPRFPEATGGSDAVALAREGWVQPLCFQPQLPEPLLNVVRRAIEIEPDARFPNATSMLFDLRRVALELGVGDARFFLRRLLEREVRESFEDTTAQTDLTRPLPNLAPLAEPEALALDALELVDDDESEDRIVPVVVDIHTKRGLSGA